MNLQALGSLSLLGLTLALIVYVTVRAIIMQGGAHLFLTKSTFANRHKVYKVPFGKGQLKSELLKTGMVICIDAVFIASMLKLGIFKNSEGSILLGFVIAFVWFEIWFYVSHRLLHTKALYFLHKQHHVAKVTSAFSAFSFSAAERLILLAGSFGVPVVLSHFVPLPFLGIAIYLLFNYSFNILAHSNLEIFPPRWLNYPWGRFLNAPTYHALHHSRYNGHYGLYTPYLDRIFKSQFLDYREVQMKAYQGEGLNSLGQRLPVQTPVVFITGASAGIGAALARTYAKKGYRIALSARRKDKLEALAAEIKKMPTGADALALECDVRERESLDQAVKSTLEEFGRIDVVIANAGFGVYGDIERLSRADYERQFDTNVYGVIHTVQATLDALKNSKGRLAIVGSVLSYMSFPSTSPYAMSKYAVRALSESLYFELKPFGVSVTLLCPGIVDTDFRKVDSQGVFSEQRVDETPSYIAMPADVAAVQIKKAIDSRKREKVITRHGKFGVSMRNYFPWIYSFVVAKARQPIKKYMDARIGAPESVRT